MKKLDPDMYILDEEMGLVKYRGPGGDVALPYGIRSVYSDAFAGRSDIVSIAFPSSVHKLEDGSFAGCSGLRQVRLSASLHRVYRPALEDCPHLSEIRISAANQKNSMVQGILITDYGKSVRFALFGVRELPPLPETVKRIYGYAFMNLPVLTTAILPDRIERLGPGAFAGCSALRKVKLPVGLERISQDTFAGCAALTEITFPPALQRISQRAFGDSGLCRVTIPPTVQRVDKLAFENCPLEEVTLPVCLDIAPDAFEGCRVTRVTVTGTPKTDSLFRRAREPVWNLIYDTFWKGVTHLRAPETPFPQLPSWLHEAVFREGAELEMAGQPLPGDLRTAMMKFLKRNRRTLWRDRSFLPLIIREGMIGKEEILDLVEQAAQLGDGEITAVLLEYQNRLMPPEEMARIRQRKMRQEMRSLETGRMLVRDIQKVWSYRVLQDGTVEMRGYRGNGVHVEVPEKVGRRQVVALAESAMDTWEERLTEEAQETLRQIECVVLPEGLKQVGGNAFRGCVSLKQLVLPSTLEDLGIGAFESCISLQEVTLPEDLRCIPERLFHNCTGLREAVVPKRVSEVGSGAFLSCRGLTRAVLKGMQLTLGEWAFQDCRALREVRITGTVRRVRSAAFRGCGSLEEVAFPEGLESLEDRAFALCPALRVLKLPGSVNMDGNTLYQDCPQVTIRAPEGSSAQRYAVAYGLRYECPGEED